MAKRSLSACVSSWFAQTVGCNCAAPSRLDSLQRSSPPRPLRYSIRGPAKESDSDGHMFRPARLLDATRALLPMAVCGVPRWRSRAECAGAFSSRAHAVCVPGLRGSLRDRSMGSVRSPVDTQCPSHPRSFRAATPQSLGSTLARVHWRAISSWPKLRLCAVLGDF